MKEYIDQAHEIKSIKNVSFSGGEAMMHYDQLKECVAHAAGLGFNTALVTNCFWAADHDKGRGMMSGLVDAGLKQVYISLDKYHQEYVSVETVRKAMRILID